MNVAYLGWCPTQTAYTAYSIVHIHRPGHEGTLASDLKGVPPPPPPSPPPVHTTAAGYTLYKCVCDKYKMSFLHSINCKYVKNIFFKLNRYIYTKSHHQWAFNLMMVSVIIIKYTTFKMWKSV